MLYWFFIFIFMSFSAILIAFFSFVSCRMFKVSPMIPEVLLLCQFYQLLNPNLIFLSLVLICYKQIFLCPCSIIFKIPASVLPHELSQAHGDIDLIFLGNAGVFCVAHFAVIAHRCIIRSINKHSLEEIFGYCFVACILEQDGFDYDFLLDNMFSLDGFCWFHCFLF